MPAKTDYIVVFVTTSSTTEASKIAKALVREKLAACCNLLNNIRSIYTWKDKLCEENECLIIMKTQAKLFKKLAARIIRLHSYQVPEIIAIPVVAGSKPYLDWIRTTTSKS